MQEGKKPLVIKWQIRHSLIYMVLIPINWAVIVKSHQQLIQMWTSCSVDSLFLILFFLNYFQNFSRDSTVQLWTLGHLFVHLYRKANCWEKVGVNCESSRRKAAPLDFEGHLQKISINSVNCIRSEVQFNEWFDSMVLALY